ncbi:unnamed protein product [Closterium sp. Yama58-4]|nr:unnamed protein product [Closterium sp. Yama58-4]
MHSNGLAQGESEDDVFAEGSKFVSLNNVSWTGGTTRQSRARKTKELRKGKRSPPVRTGKKSRADALADGGCGADKDTQDNGQHAHDETLSAAAASINPSSAYANAATHQLAASQSIPGLPSASASLSAAAASINPSSAYANAATHQLAASQSIPGLPSASASLSAAAASINPSSAYANAATHQLAASQSIPGLPSASASLSAAAASINPSSAYANAATHQLAASQSIPGLPSASASLSAAAASINPSSAYANAATHQLAASQSIPGLPSASASLSAAAASINPSSAYANAATHQLAASQSIPGLPSASASLSAAAASINPSSAYANAATHQLAASQSIPGLPSASASLSAAAASINPSSAYANAATHQLAASQSMPGLPSASASLSAAAASINPSSAYANAATHQLAASQSMPGLPSASASLSAAAASINPSSAYANAATHQLAASQSIPGLPSASASLSAAAASINPSSAYLNAATHQLAARISPSAADVHVSVPALSSPAVAPGWTSLPPAPSALSPSTSYINPEFHPTNSGQPGSGLIPPASATPAAVVAPPATQLQPSGLPWTLRVRKQKSALPDPGPSHVEAGSDEDSDDDDSLENQVEHGGEQRPAATRTSRAAFEAAQAQLRQQARRIAELENQLHQPKGPHAGSHAMVQRQANLPSPSQQLPVAPQPAPSTTRPCTQPNATHPLIFSPVVWPRTQAAFSRAVAKAHIKRQAIDCSAMSPRQCGWYNNVITALDAFPDVNDDLKTPHATCIHALPSLPCSLSHSSALCTIFVALLQDHVDEALDIMFFDTPVTDFSMWPSTERLEAALRRALGLTEPEEHFIVRIVLKADKYRNSYIRDLIQAFRNDALTDGRNWVYDAFDLHVPRPRLGGKRVGTLTTVLFLDQYAESEYEFTLLSDPRPYPTKVTARP